MAKLTKARALQILKWLSLIIAALSGGPIVDSISQSGIM
jgi:hypothetical protein